MGWTNDRARLAALTRHRNPDDPALSDARRDFHAERLAEAVRRVVDSAPPLTTAQRDTIAALLRAPVTPVSTPAQRGKPAQRTAKTFTQADLDLDLDLIIADRVARLEKKFAGHEDRRKGSNGSVGETGGAA